MSGQVWKENRPGYSGRQPFQLHNKQQQKIAKIAKNDKQQPTIAEKQQQESKQGTAQEDWE